MSPDVSKVSLRRRVDRALLAAGALLLVTLVLATAALVAVRERQREVLEIYYEAITRTGTAYEQVLNAETAVRGYLLTGDEIALEPLQRVLDQPEPEIDVEAMLEEHFGADSEVVRTREAAGDAAETWYFEWAEPAMATVRAEGTQAITPADVEEGRVLFEEVRTPIEEHERLLKEGRLDAVDALRGATYQLVAAVAALALLLLVGGVLLWVFLRRWVTAPLEGLAQDVRIVSEGDLTHPVRREGAGEVLEVSTVVEAMRSRLVRVIHEADEAKAALEASHARLEEQAEDLSRSNRDLEQFAYVASHDLQEPLRKIASFTQLLQKRYEGQLDERADQYIAFAVDGAKRMQRLINDLLGFSRVGRIGGELTDVSLGRALDQVRTDLSEAIAESGAVVTGEDLPVVRGEEPLLVQLLTNLVGNAIKFRSPDRAPEIRFSAREVDGHWEFACHDNGIGIDPQYADRVFVIFQRLHPKDVYEGTGIGLALCKKIVEYHGGDIWIDTETTEGTTIRWTLPVGEAASARVNRTGEIGVVRPRGAADAGDTRPGAQRQDTREGEDGPDGRQDDLPEQTAVGGREDRTT